MEAVRNGLTMVVLLAVAGAGCLEGAFDDPEPDASTLALLEELASFPEWRMEMDHGTIRMVLYTGWLPTTTDNIIRITESGYYTDTLVYRVIDDFVIQGGDQDESDADILLEGEGVPLETYDGLDFGSGAVGLARLTQDDGTGHYFITEKPQLHLSRPERSNTGAVFGEYSLFGQVFEGQGVVRSIAEVETDDDDRPVEDVVLYNAMVRPPPEDADLLNLVPDVFPDVSTAGYDGVFEAPRVLVTDHPLTFRFTADTPESGACTVVQYVLQAPDGQRTVLDWEPDPIDGCTFEATITFQEPGVHLFDLGVHTLDLPVLPWHEAYRPYTGTAIGGV